MTATVGEALSAATDALRAAGVGAPRLDAELLLAEATGRHRARLAAEPEAGVEPATGRAFGAMVRRRLGREPVAYILGRKAFRGIEVVVDRRVLIPRPETELLVEIALELSPANALDPVLARPTALDARAGWGADARAGAGESSGGAPFRVLEVGTGSGAVALALARELPGAELTATDTSAAALEVAAANAERLGLAGRVRFVAGSLPAGQRYELVVANLPYVREDEWPRLQPEIVRHEPREALVGGPDGLDAIRGLVGALRPAAVCDSVANGLPNRTVAPGTVVAGAVALEVGAGQAGAVAELVREAGFARAECRQDLAGVERAVVGDSVGATGRSSAGRTSTGEDSA